MYVVYLDKKQTVMTAVVPSDPIQDLLWSNTLHLNTNIPPTAGLESSHVFPTDSVQGQAVLQGWRL